MNRNLSAAFFFSLLLSAGVFTAFHPAQAATIAVTTTDDEHNADGDCSLREAIIAANTNTAVDGCAKGDAGADTITIPEGTFLLSRTGTGEDAADTGDLDIAEDLNISGQGETATLINGGDGSVASPDRIFHVLAGNVTISGMTLRNGQATGNGGAVLNAGAGSLTLQRCALLENRTTGSGGAVSNASSGTFTLDTCTLSGNKAIVNGGGIETSSKETAISGSTISGNIAQSGADGGLVAYNSAAGSRLTLTNTIVSDNVAFNYAGGLDTSAETVEIAGCTISGNTALTNTDGGMVSFNSGAGSKLTVTDTQITNNLASNYGGGLDTSNETVEISGSTISGNVAVTNTDGGMVAFNSSPNSRLTITGTSINDNSAGNYGGGLDTSAKVVEILDSTISGNSALNNTDGGMVSFNSSAGSKLTISGSTISNNLAKSYGGGLDASNETIEISDSTISGNVSLTNTNGGIITFNAAAPSSLTVTNATISDNSSNTGAGGLETRAKTATLTNVTITGNKSATAAGVYNSGVGTVTLRNSIVANNASGNCFGTITSGGHNLESANDCGFSGTGDLINTDPLLAPLADNGGKTQTRNLQSGSPAIDAGDDTLCPTEDQRGVSRPLDGNADGTARCDIGAVESNRCGDAVAQTELGEECDDGNSDNTDACTNECKAAVCGDSFLEAGVEQCDSGASNSDTVADACRTDCQAASCGDGVVDTGEACDDGNTADKDGCSTTCTVEKSGGCSLVR